MSDNTSLMFPNRTVALGRVQAPAPGAGRPLGILLVVSAVLGLIVGAGDVAQRWGYRPHGVGSGNALYVASHTAIVWCWAIVAVGMGTALGILVVAHRYWRYAIVSAMLAGLAWLVARGPVYSPLQLLTWTGKYARVAVLFSAVEHGWLVAGVVFTVAFTGCLAATMADRTRVPSGSFGTARWGQGEALRNDRGLLVGRLDRVPLRYGGDGHLVTVAPTRSGKGVSVIIPNLLTYPGSVVVVDPKGENYMVTARRRKELGSTVIAFDPFGVVGGGGAFNPLSVIDPESPDAVDDARMLAEMLVVVDGRESGEQTFWNEEARALLSGLILHVAAEPEAALRTLNHVRTLLTLPPILFGELLEQMAASSAAGGLVARSAARLLQKADKERSGVISSAQSHTHFLDSPRMGMVLSTSTVDLATLRSQHLSLYLVLPPHHLETYHRWIRLMIASCLSAVTRQVLQGKQEGEERIAPVGKRRVIFLVDEFGHLGKMRPIEQFIGLVGAYGVSFWLFIQDLSQLKAVYTERWQTFLANADVIQTFGNNDWETVEYFSKMTGEATIFTDSENRSRGVSYGRNGSRQDGTAATLSERGRRLLTPDEVRRLGPTQQLLFVKSSDAVLAKKLSYFDADPMFLGHADANPMYRMGTP